ncbi:MAG TPA: dephospho-CoA kinase [Clostridia bacterium]|nr:dephospho-CoA kinase [Clostridia bacterium]
MYTIGLTGGIGSGKSTVGAMLAELGAVVIDTDRVAREVVAPGSETLREIVQFFGTDVLQADGSLDRKKLGALVFADEAKRKMLNRITHPAIKKAVGEKLAQIERQDPEAVVVIEAPLLMEAGMTSMVDEVWLVTVDPETQLRRVMDRDHLSLEAALQRIRSQLSSAEQAAYSDVVISTAQSLAQVQREVEKHWERLKKAARR